MPEPDVADGPEYDVALEETVEDCAVWGDRRINVSSATDLIETYDLIGDLVDVSIEWNENTIPLTDAPVRSRGRIPIPKRVVQRYGIPTGRGATVDVTFHGVIRNE